MAKQINPIYVPGEIPDEIWKDIDGFDGQYRISNYGRVLSMNYHRSGQQRILRLHTPKRKTSTKSKDMYPYVILSKNAHTYVRKIHRCVANAFIPNPENKPYVNHIDGNINNNHISNLEWVTPSENNIHAYKVLGKHPASGFKFGLNKRSKPIHQFYINEFGARCYIASYANVLAAELLTGIKACSIKQAARKKPSNGRNCKYLQAGGYVWEYADSLFVKLIETATK